LNAGDDATVRDNREASRFEISVDGHVAFLKYERRPGMIVLVHTEVPLPLRGHGVAGTLAKSALEAAHAEGIRVIAKCKFVREYMKKHPTP
jgi:predicted GNAT family acetyltransferase